jgi:aminoglycoside phosphotransferase (APT) family kinase protein
VHDLTPALVTEALRARLGPGAACRALVRGPVGNGQETWFAEVEGVDGAGELVIRRTASGGPLEWTRRDVEAAAMRQAAGAGLPVPRVRWVEEEGPLGMPSLVMDRAPGEPATRAGGASPQTVAEELGAHLADLHGARLRGGGRGPASAAPATREELRRWEDVHRRDAAAASPLAAGLLAWLAANVPEDGQQAVLLWGDAGPHNALVADGHVSALLDWELSHLGHPLDDVGAGVWIYLGTGLEEALVEGYEHRAGHAIDRSVLDFFVTMACVTRSVMVLAGAGAFVAGRTSAPTLAGLGLQLAARHLGLAAERAGWGAVPSVELAPAEPSGLRPSPWEVDEGLARFLHDAVLAEVGSSHVRRGVKAMAGVLRANALRTLLAPAVAARRAEAEAALRERLRGTRFASADLVSVAVQVETDPAAAHLRPAVRAHLLEDLALERAALGPLDALFG